MFSPYHRFSNCNILEYHINVLNRAGNITPDVLSAYNNYHYALVYKLKCAKDYLDDLANILNNTPPGEVFGPNANRFMFSVNRNIDGFFYSLGSSLDILAREVLSYYGFALPARVYFHHAYTIMNTTRGTEPILTKLGNPTWKEKFSDYRNTLTHELIIADRLDIRAFMRGNLQETNIICYLPDDPKTIPEDRTFNNNIDALIYTKKTFIQAVSLVNQIYNIVIAKIKVQGNMPL